VKFEQKAIHIYNAAGKKEISIFESELPALVAFLQNSSYQEQLRFWNSKQTKELLPDERENLVKRAATEVKAQTKSLKGYRIAIDPGHFATTRKEAASEQKFLYFPAKRADFPYDSVKLFESELSFNTAALLKNMLEQEGAEVFLSRGQNNFTSFNCTYSEWMQRHKIRVLDSLHKCGKLSPAKKASLQKASPYNLFWDFFRDFDLQNRAEKINRYHPDICIIIHYNVDEKNAPWTRFTEKDYTMAFVGGGFTSGNLSRTEMKINFLRMLLCPQLNQSNLLSSLTVEQFHKQLGIPIAKQNDAKYLRENSMATPAQGVYSRNLLLCRQINSVLVYGEALYQDNAMEAAELMKLDLQYKGINTNQRLFKVAQAYFEALKEYVKINE